MPPGGRKPLNRSSEDRSKAFLSGRFVYSPTSDVLPYSIFEMRKAPEEVIVMPEEAEVRKKDLMDVIEHKRAVRGIRNYVDYN